MDSYELRVTFAQATKLEGAYVNVIASKPPPAPARACAMLSLCCAAELAATDA